MHKLPPLHILAAFESVVRHKSFTKAAEELCITKSAVSHRIKLLETYFDTRFLSRRNGCLMLTPEGSLFVEAVREALGTLQAACAQMLAPTRKVVRVSVRPALASNWLVQRMGDFHRIHGDIDLEVYASKVTNLRSVGADIAICYGKANEWPGYETRKLISGHLFPVCSPAYRQTLGKLEHPRVLLKATLLRHPRHPWKPWFRAASVHCAEPATGPLFSDAHLMLHAAVNNQGVALAFDVLAENDLRAGRLVRLFDLGIPSDCAYYAVYPEFVRSNPVVTTFLDWLIATSIS